MTVTNSGGERDEVLTIGEVAAWLRFSEAVIYRMAQKGKIPARKVGRGWRFFRGELEQFIKECAQLVQGDG